MDFKDIQHLAYKGYREKGFLEKWEKARKILREHGLERIVDLAELGLVVTEIAEAMEEIRDDNSKAESKELAGVFIRLSNYSMRKGYNLESEIIRESRRNLTRPKLHRRKVM